MLFGIVAGDVAGRRVGPNEFGALCGDPNAYCIITLPICPETRSTLIALKDDPGLILRRIKSENEDLNLALVLTGAHKALAAFRGGIANLGAAQSRSTSQASDSPAEWVNSDNADLSLRLSVKSELLTSEDAIVLIASIRNNRAEPVTICVPLVNTTKRSLAESRSGTSKGWSSTPGQHGIMF